MKKIGKKMNRRRQAGQYGNVSAELNSEGILSKKGHKKIFQDFFFACSTHMEKVHAMSDKKSLFKLGCTRQASTKHGTTKKTTPNWDGI